MGGFCVPASVCVSGVGLQKAVGGKHRLQGVRPQTEAQLAHGPDDASLGWVHEDGAHGTHEAVAKTHVMNPSFRETPGEEVKRVQTVSGRGELLESSGLPSVGPQRVRHD